jgi:hypothetical protein
MTTKCNEISYMRLLERKKNRGKLDLNKIWSLVNKKSTILHISYDKCTVTC